MVEVEVVESKQCLCWAGWLWISLVTAMALLSINSTGQQRRQRVLRQLLVAGSSHPMDVAAV